MFPEKLPLNGCQTCQHCGKKQILQQFSTVCTSYRHQNVQKFAVKPLAIPLEFEHVDVISMVNKGTYHGKFLSIR